MKCWACVLESDDVRTFAMHVDGEPLRLQPKFCRDHGDQFLLTVGKVIGEMVRKNGESGRPVPEPAPARLQDFAPFTVNTSPEEPDITISGRPEGDCDAYQTRAGRDYYCDRGAGHVDPHHNANVGEWAGDMRGERGVPAEFVEGRFAMPLVTSDELARRDGPPRTGRGADFPRDDGTYVVNVVPDPPKEEGTAVVGTLNIASPELTCKRCGEKGHAASDRYVEPAGTNCRIAAARKKAP